VRGGGRAACCLPAGRHTGVNDVRKGTRPSSNKCKARRQVPKNPVKTMPETSGGKRGFQKSGLRQKEAALSNNTAHNRRNKNVNGRRLWGHTVWRGGGEGVQARVPPGGTFLPRNAGGRCPHGLRKKPPREARGASKKIKVCSVKPRGLAKRDRERKKAYKREDGPIKYQKKRKGH